MGTQVTYAENLPEISSEFIEPYLKRFLMIQVESIAFGYSTVEEAKKHLDSVSFFTTCFCGVHAKLATGNIYGSFLNTKDDDLLKICRKTFDIPTPD